MTKAGKWRNSFITNLARLAVAVGEIAEGTILVVTVTVAVIVILAGITNSLPSLIALILQLQ